MRERERLKGVTGCPPGSRMESLDTAGLTNTPSRPWEYSATERLAAAIEQRCDGVPRIHATGFSKEMKLFKLFMCFSKFGVVTYIVQCGQHVVVEFTKMDVVVRIVRLGTLRLDGANVKVERLKWFLHREHSQLEFSLDPEIMDILSSANSLQQYTDNFVAVCDAKQREVEPHSEIVTEVLKDILNLDFPNCMAYPFGSRVTRLSLPVCDLDIFLDVGDMFYGNVSQLPHEQDYLVTKVYKLLVRHQDFKFVQAVPRARTPILRFLYLPTNSRCDVAFRHGLGLQNTKLLIFLMSLDQRIRPMILFLKQWSFLQNIRGTLSKGEFSSYALTMMLVYYLQQLPEPVLPTISYLQSLCSDSKMIIAGWECSFTTDKSLLTPTRNTQSMPQLLEGFFKFYHSFDYSGQVVCPLLGAAVPRRDFMGNMVPLQPAMSRYIRLLRNKMVERFATRSTICVQDPFDHSHNLTRSVKEDVLMSFISSCGLSSSLLEKYSKPS